MLDAWSLLTQHGFNVQMPTELVAQNFHREADAMRRRAERLSGTHTAERLLQDAAKTDQKAKDVLAFRTAFNENPDFSRAVSPWPEYEPPYVTEIARLERTADIPARAAEKS